MIAVDGKPFARIVRDLPTNLTGEYKYLDSNGVVWHGRAWQDHVTNGVGTRARIVNGHVVPDTGSSTVTIVAAPPRPPAQREPNRHERRKQAALQRRRR